MSQAKRKQLRLRLGIEMLWDQFPETSRSHCLELLCQLLKEVVAATSKPKEDGDE